MNIQAANKTEKPFHIVGVGGSAGGLHAFTELLKAIPKDTGMAFVFVQHLDPEQASHLSVILAKTTTIPVVEVTATTKLQSNHIYTMPSDKDITITDGTLHLIKRTNSPSVHKPIDVFFTSLAKDQSELAVGVILSGAGVDGTAGLKDIKANGGVTFAQDETAEYKDMPHSAVGAGVVDFVLRPSKVAQRIIQMSGGSTADEDGVEPILGLLKTTTGIDFRAYKATTVQRRIWRRMALSDRKTLADYRKLLTTNPDELEALQKDMLIHVTSFFRDSEQFQVLKKTVFPAILNHRSTTEPINVWIPGCASGEEVYSMAIALTEYLDGQTTIPFRILGTDVSKAAIEKARQGLYQENIKEHVSPKRLRQFFTKVASGYQVNGALLDVCQFLVQDVSDSPPVAKVDLISCQNVLIYLSSELQQKVFFRLHSVLEPDGFLVLGKSESIGLSTELFREFDSKHKIYTKVTTGDKQAVGSGVPDTLQTTINTLVDIDAPQSGASEQVDRQQKIIKLREALSLTQEYADSIIGELDVMNEAMQSSNEELMTISEESQAGNEALKTLSKELETRNEEMTLARDYAEAIIKTVREPLIILDGKLRVKSASKSFYTTFMVTPEQTENILLYDLGNQQWNIPVLRTLLEKTLPKNNTLTDYEVVHDFRDIGRKTMLLNARTLQQGPDKMPLILLAIEDITDRKQLEQQKDEFMRIASHELKTPVTSIKAYAQIMQRRFERKNDDESAKNMARMNAQLDKLTGLIGDLLDVTKIEAGKMQFQLQSFDFDALVMEIAETMQLTSERHEVIVKGRAGKPAWGDRERTGQVIINLIGNAIKYSPHSGKITVSVKSNDTEITTSVRDYGLGISREKQEKVFERFFRVSDPSTESFSGLGLGLYISAEIIRRLGGKIWVKSTTGKGSTFCFTLPVNMNVIAPHE